jgi:Predicted transcriptional regulator
LSVRAFELSIGASDGMIRKAINNKTDIQSKWLTKISEIYPDINTEWLITGQGEMLRSSEVNTPIVNYTSAGNPYYNVDFQGGFELLLNDQTINPEYYINFEPFNQSGAVWCNVSGKSMEPEISNGDKIVLKEVKDWKTFLPMGEIYGVITDEFRTIKRIRKATNPENWLLVPSNPDYDKQEIPIIKIRAIFQVLGSVKML